MRFFSLHFRCRSLRSALPLSPRPGQADAAQSSFSLRAEQPWRHSEVSAIVASSLKSWRYLSCPSCCAARNARRSSAVRSTCPCSA